MNWNRPGLYIILAILALIALIVLASIGGRRYRAEVCMTYHGRTACKTVSGKTKAAVVQGAITNACADIAQGMTETMACQQTPPQRITWLTVR